MILLRKTTHKFPIKEAFANAKAMVIDMFVQAKLIEAPDSVLRVPLFRKSFTAACKKGVLTLGGYGTFDVYLNGKRVGDTVLAPGWQDYRTRICTARYTLAELKSENTLDILLTPGWYSGRINRNPDDKAPRAIIAELSVGDTLIVTDETWTASSSPIVSADIYDGIVADARLPYEWHEVRCIEGDKSLFAEDTTVPTREFETVYPCELITTPRGERVLDFGANIVGYPVLELNAAEGDRFAFSFAEILDHDGNFYNENYRSALCRYDYTCRDGMQTFVPRGTFYGWRYLRIDVAPDEFDPTSGGIYARVIHADMMRTGNIKTGNALVNRLFDNVLRGQLGNYLSVPTDCPQRDERLGWTGDAQMFIKAAAYNFDVYDFIGNWLRDMVSSQSEDGVIRHIIPVLKKSEKWIASMTPASAWSDAITIIPWELYEIYGDASVLERCYDAMCRHVDCIGRFSGEKYLFTGGKQYGDWLGLDSFDGSYKGASNPDIISSAYYAHSCELTVRAGKVIGRETAKYEELYEKITAAFREKYEPVLATQTECALALRFGLVSDREAITERLSARIHAAGDKLETGFVGTPYILHALAENGECELAYTLFMNTGYPSWLYPVTMGATTMWEHWDGIRPDGKLWSRDMNSYNHYAYGAVVDWIYSVAAGIRPHGAGFSSALITPHPDKRLGTLDVTFESRHGRFESAWYYEGDTAHYRITVPVPSIIIIDGKARKVDAGTYVM